MSFLISKSLEGLVDEESLIDNSSIATTNLINNKTLIVDLENLSILTFKKNKVLIEFYCEELIIKKFIDKAIEIIKLSSITFNNLLLKQIIKKDNLYICKILCKEASN